MVQIKIKGINGQYHIYASYDDEVAFLNELKDRLKTCLENKQDFSAYFHFLRINESLLYKVITMCQELDIVIKGILNEKEDVKKHSITKVTNLPLGEESICYDDVMILGDMKADMYVTAYQDVYVIGCARGVLDFMYERCCLYASSIDAKIRICESVFQNVTIFAPVCVYYEEGKVLYRELKEERMWERQLR